MGALLLPPSLPPGFPFLKWVLHPLFKSMQSLKLSVFVPHRDFPLFHPSRDYFTKLVSCIATRTYHLDLLLLATVAAKL